MIDHQYEEALRTVLVQGYPTPERTGTGATSYFGLMLKYDLQQGFPLITTKKVHMQSVISELLWILSGSTNVKDLQAMRCSIWDEWADPETGDLGPVYGAQWRSWQGEHKYHDQISDVVHSLKNNPFSRRHIVSAWNVDQLDQMKLHPCHALFQFHVRPIKGHKRAHWYIKNGGANDSEFMNATMSDAEAYLDRINVPKMALSCQLYQRSADMFLGVPFNIASYALLTHMMAQQVNMIPDLFIWNGGNCHIYDNHHEQVSQQLSREPFEFPTLKLNKQTLSQYTHADVVIENYNHHPAISAPVAV